MTTLDQTPAKIVFPSRPALAFRVGVTGARRLEADQSTRVLSSIGAALDLIRAEVTLCADMEEARRIYDAGRGVNLRVVSPLAEGADRWVAREALSRGFALEVPMPFKQADYETTFDMAPANAQGEFASLLARAEGRVFALDGDRSSDIDRPRSYGAIGRMVVRNCDLVIAIWDAGQPAKGPGGTRDTVHFALSRGVPVWWIDAAHVRSPAFLANMIELDRALDAPDADAEARLRGYIGATIGPPGRKTGAKTTRERDPLRTYFLETGTPNRKFWNLHPTIVRKLRDWGSRRHGTTQPATGEASQAQPTPAVGARGDVGWAAAARRRLATANPLARNAPLNASSPAAALSTIYKHRYRTSYVVVFIGGAVALGCAALGLWNEKLELATAPVELVALATIGGFVLANYLQGWHERYVSYRMLGEIRRMSRYLSLLGWCLPSVRIGNMARHSHRAWVGWLGAAFARETPMLAVTLTKDYLESARGEIRDGLVAEQIRFHVARWKECEGAARLLGWWGRLLFLLTFLLVLVRVGLFVAHEGHEVISYLALATTVLPAASAAFFGLRAYEEFELLAEQSEHMVVALETARKSIDDIDLDKPLASQRLAAELFDVTSIMMADVGGWAQLLGMKMVEV